MLKTVEGIYKAGQIELAETPAAIDEARVLVTFLEPSSANGEAGQGDGGTATKDEPRYLRFGMFPELLNLTEEDFRSAEWRGEDEDDEVIQVATYTVPGG